MSSSALSVRHHNPVSLHACEYARSSEREERERERRERERERVVENRWRDGFSLVVSSPPFSPAHSKSNLLSLPPFLRSQPLRLDIKVRTNEKKEKRGDCSCFSFSFSLSIFSNAFLSRFSLLTPNQISPLSDHHLPSLSPTKQQKRFSQRTDRVKGVDLHPTEPW